ncbi:hypothetical protein [Paraburkholderia kururiensis]|uniref:hypothetical protein n=1 Tax=Paraburkholderia kururiensis TaxID=984307 RepID=UPI0018F50273|nr:hypothetical protein [Paraburkholderia kururiensis]
MSAIPHSPDLHLRCRCRDAGALPAHLIRAGREGLRLQMDRVAREDPSAPAVILGLFGALALFTLLFRLEDRTIPTLVCFAGMIVWIAIFYGVSGQIHWTRIRSATLLQVGRMNAWLAMLTLSVLSGWRMIEQRIRVILGMLAVVLDRLRACLRIRLGLADFNLTALRLVPPKAAHA